MQKASELVPSGMMTVFLGPRSKAKLACEVAKRYCVTRLNIEDACCAVANYLYPECKVIAGNVEVREYACCHVWYAGNIGSDTKEYILKKKVLLILQQDTK